MLMEMRRGFGGWGGGVAPVTAVCHLCGGKWSRGGTPVKRIPLRYCLNQLGAGGGPQVVFDQHERMLWRMSTVSLTANDHPQSAQTVGVYGKWLRERGLAERRGETPLTRERDGLEDGFRWTASERKGASRVVSN